MKCETRATRGYYRNEFTRYSENSEHFLVRALRIAPEAAVEVR